jgi:hypothetical protein
VRLRNVRETYLRYATPDSAATYRTIPACRAAGLAPVTYPRLRVIACPQMTPARLRSVCRALLILNLAYCTAALFLEELPGWKMFESVEALDYVLRDEAGRALDVHDALPANAHLIDAAQLRRVVQFICEHHRGPLWFEATRGGPGEWLHSGACAPHAQL